MTYLIFANDDFLDQVTMTQFDEIRTIKGAGNLTTGDKRESFNSFEISVFDHENPLLCQYRFWIVVDQLSVYKHVDAMSGDGFHFRLHFFLGGETTIKLANRRSGVCGRAYSLRSFQFREFSSAVDLHTCTKDLDFIGIHC